MTGETPRVQGPPLQAERLPAAETPNKPQLPTTTAVKTELAEAKKTSPHPSAAQWAGYVGKVILGAIATPLFVAAYVVAVPLCLLAAVAYEGGKSVNNTIEDYTAKKQGLEQPYHQQSNFGINVAVITVFPLLFFTVFEPPRAN